MRLRGYRMITKSFGMLGIGRGEEGSNSGPATIKLTLLCDQDWGLQVGKPHRESDLFHATSLLGSCILYFNLKSHLQNSTHQMQKKRK